MVEAAGPRARGLPDPGTGKTIKLANRIIQYQCQTAPRAGRNTVNAASKNSLSNRHRMFIARETLLV